MIVCVCAVFHCVESPDRRHFYNVFIGSRQTERRVYNCNSSKAHSYSATLKYLQCVIASVYCVCGSIFIALTTAIIVFAFNYLTPYFDEDLKRVSVIWKRRNKF